GVRIKDAALIAAATLSDRYITDRFLPDKAIDLIDEAASRLRIEIDSLPTEIDEVDRKITQQQIARQALKKEKDKSAREQLTRLDEELAVLKKKSAEMTEHWKKEKEVIDRIRAIKADIDRLKLEEEKAERLGDLAKISEIRYGGLVELQKKLEEESKRLTEVQKTTKMLKEEVDEEYITEVVARWTGIPLSKLMEGDIEKLVSMEERLQKRVVGQDEAISLIANALRRSRSGLSDPKRPIGAFMFLGPTGCGKTHLAKSLAWFLFDNEEAMVRIDMSEYMDKHTTSRLVGAPPGYVGYEEGGQLTEAVRRRPYSIVLFDEIEKAHRDVFNILLQILDDGRLTDGQGRTVNFRNTVIIMTSNLGSQYFQAEEKSKEDISRLINADLKNCFRPEFLNRLDEIIVFNKLKEADIANIVTLQLDALKASLAEKKITLEVSSAVKDHLAQEGFDPVYGARPLKRIIQRKLQDQIAHKLLKGEVRAGGKIKIEYKGGEFCFN
ncbi:MAG: AAA family ATPase, partial [Candidatus Omnitrophota bacterium]